MKCPDTPHSIIAKLKSPNSRAWNCSWSKFHDIYNTTLKQMTINAYMETARKAPTDDDIVEIVFNSIQSVRSAFENGTYEPNKYKFRGFLKTIIKRRTVDYIRHQLRKRKIQFTDQEIENFNTPVYDTPLEDNEDQQYHNALINDICETARTNFDAKTWLCFEMRHLRGLKISTICDELDIDAKKVYKNIYKVTKEIRKQYLSPYYQKELKND